MKPQYLRLVSAALFLLATLAALPARAADAAAGEALGDLYEVARVMDAAVLDLNMLLGEDQSPRYRERFAETLKKLDAALAAAGPSLASAGVSGADADTITRNTNAFAKLARANRDTLLRSGMPEGAVVDEMMLRRKDARKAIDQVYADLEKRAGLAGSPLSNARELALVLQQAAALYVETSASAGGVSYRTPDSEEESIDTLARKFGSGLDRLLPRTASGDIAKQAAGIKTKWQFIEKSLLNYRENMVPFLVDRYTQSIVNDLLQVAQQLEQPG